MKQNIKTISMLLCLFVLSSFAQPSLEPLPSSSGPNYIAKLVEANNDFAFRLLSEITKNDPPTNIFISPTSITNALDMVYNGAAGETKLAMVKTLALEGFPIEKVNEANLNLMNQLTNADSKITLAIANSLWASENINLKVDFINQNTKYYKAEVTKLDFNNKTSVSRINDWVNTKTNKKIPEIIDALNPSLVLLLINAVYFKGLWEKPFDKNETHEGPFTLLDSTKKQVNMMNRSDKYFYFEDANTQGIQLEYGDKSRMQMYIFLPKAHSSLNDFLATLNMKNFYKLNGQFRFRSGSITMPRLRFNYELMLNNILKNLGMTNTFENANFSGISKEPAFISGVKHKTFLEVNEEGTEAAAVTSVSVGTGMQMPEEPFLMTVNRPYVLVIRDRGTGTILFMGTIVDPVEKE